MVAHSNVHRLHGAIAAKHALAYNDDIAEGRVRFDGPLRQEDATFCLRVLLLELNQNLTPRHLHVVQGRLVAFVAQKHFAVLDQNVLDVAHFDLVHAILAVHDVCADLRPNWLQEARGLVHCARADSNHLALVRLLGRCSGQQKAGFRGSGCFPRPHQHVVRKGLQATLDLSALNVERPSPHGRDATAARGDAEAPTPGSRHEGRGSGDGGDQESDGSCRTAARCRQPSTLMPSPCLPPRQSH
mmetsp:Transcript_24068/g.66966  ORF Transcript_24068/g.66966 Transcript_24068/m.66966 type:complete len:243 (+) Transcript_24068:290-1018(+)